MCKQMNIENLEGRLCALQNKYKGRSVTHREIMLDVDEINNIQSKPGVIYYGILTCGPDSASTLILWGKTFNVSANSQIIEMFQDIVIGDSNVWFYGYEITIQGL